MQQALPLSASCFCFWQLWQIEYCTEMVAVKGWTGVNKAACFHTVSQSAQFLLNSFSEDMGGCGRDNTNHTLIVTAVIVGA